MKRRTPSRRSVIEPVERRVLLATISGNEFSDVNHNGVHDAGEPALPGVTLFLDTNNNGVLDAGETSTTSDASGNFSFTISGGLTNWVIAQQTPSGLVQTKPLDSFVPGRNLNVSKRTGNESEGSIAIDPTNPNRLFFATNLATGGALFGGYSTDGGATWNTRVLTDIPAACCDPSTAFDAFGNLYLAYINSGTTAIILARSITGGQTFLSTVTTFTGDYDQPTVTTGPSSVAGQQSVWLSWGKVISTTPDVVNPVAVGAPVLGLNDFGSFGAIQTLPGAVGNYADIAVGPAGQVIVGYQTKDDGETVNNVDVNIDPDGVGPTGFGSAIVVTSSNVGGFDFIPAQSGRSVDAEVGLAWDRSGGPHNGRVYLIYTDEEPDESDDMDIYLRFSDNNGATWSGRLQVNDDATTKSQFMPKLALDQTTGNLAVVWYDSRNSPGNDTAQIWGSISTDGGASFQPNKQISAGTSNSFTANNGIDFGDYIGLAFHGGNFFPLWADNSNSTGDNPNGTNSRLDIYTSRVAVLGPTAPSRYGVIAGGTTNISGLEFGNHDIAVPTVTSRNSEFLTRQAINFVFSENVSASLSPADLTLTNLTTSTPVPTGDILLSYDTATNTATFTFTHLLADGNYHAELNSAGVTDPSGNALAAANTTLDIFILAGDANRDRTVDVTDLGILATFWQQSGANFGQGDFNYDHLVDVTDLGILATNWQKSLPAPASPVALPAAIRPQPRRGTRRLVDQLL